METHVHFGAFCLDVRTLTFLPTEGFSIKPLKVKLLAGEQKATEFTKQFLMWLPIKIDSHMGASRNFGGPSRYGAGGKPNRTNWRGP